MSARKEKNRADFEQHINAITDSSYKVYGSHSYAAGYLGSMVRVFFDSLSLKEQESWISTLEKSAADMDAKLVAKAVA